MSWKFLDSQNPFPDPQYLYLQSKKFGGDSSKVISISNLLSS